MHQHPAGDADRRRAILFICAFTAYRLVRSGKLVPSGFYNFSNS